MEHKSLSADISDPNSTLVYQLLINLYRNVGINISDSGNLTQLNDDSEPGLQVLLQNCLQQLYLQPQGKRLYKPPLTLMVLLSLLYGALSLTSLVGNGLVIWVVLGSKKMRTVTNLFICNLAAADLIVGLLVAPFHFQAALLQRWQLPRFLCALCPFLQVLGINLNAFTLSTIAVNRYMSVMRPLYAKTTKRKALLVIVLIWTLAVVLAVPTHFDYKVVLRYRSIFSPPTEFCHSVVYSPETRMYYNMGLFVVQYAIPVVIICFAYVGMGFHFWGGIKPGVQANGEDAILLKKKKHAIKMLTLIVLLFGICWMPYQVYNFLQYVVPAINHYEYINIIWFSMHWPAMSSSCVNPFVYAVHNKSFRRQLRGKINCYRPKFCRDRNNIPERVTGSGSKELQDGIRLQVLLSQHSQHSRASGENL